MHSSSGDLANEINEEVNGFRYSELSSIFVENVSSIFVASRRKVQIKKNEF